MKKLILSLLAVSLSVSVPMSAQMNAQVSKIRAIKCAIPYLHQRFQCTPEEIRVGKQWLAGASVAVVIAALAGLGLSAQQAHKAKRQAEQELRRAQAEFRGNVEKTFEPSYRERRLAEEAEKFEKATKSLRLGVTTGALWLAESGLQRGADPDSGAEIGGVIESYLDIAAKNNNKEMVELLLKYGATPELSPDVQTTQEIKNLIMSAPRIPRKSQLRPIRPTFPRR